MQWWWAVVTMVRPLTAICAVRSPTMSRWASTCHGHHTHSTAWLFAGLTAAILLARQGLSVRLLEKDARIGELV